MDSFQSWLACQPCTGCSCTSNDLFRAHPCALQMRGSLSAHTKRQVAYETLI